MSKTPNGFRAVRMRGKTEIVYCVERKGGIDSCCTTSGGEVDVVRADGVLLSTLTSKDFNQAYAREYSPMPDAVRAIFQGKPTFAEWWAAKGKEDAA